MPDLGAVAVGVLLLFVVGLFVVAPPPQTGLKPIVALTNLPSVELPPAVSTFLGMTTPTTTTQQQTSYHTTVTPTTTIVTSVTVTGLLDKGVEAGCLVLHSDSGEDYGFVSVPSEISNLSQNYILRLRVTGLLRPDVLSYCMEGRMLELQSYEILELIQRTQTQTLSSMLP